MFQKRPKDITGFPPLYRKQGCFILAKNRWGDGEMGRWGDGEKRSANSRNFGQIYLTLLEGRITNC
ncbi:hypothetical protein BJP34_06740 [Moorena producens PAL-8-15-08-1]|uniref:Uncharacterized protein n=1 Tax=Moorena producens PAL-8-15-08-1 TaxID=1458985 RepID=A0A1D8TNF3_9CYAN|nr:hypothetical protein BJP34_06740 [Moorena producens PAL-8-15-08-1]